MLIATYYLLLKNWDIFATRPCISLIINIDYFRGGYLRVSLQRYNFFLKLITSRGLFIYKKFRGEEFGGVEVRPIGEQMRLVPHYIHDVTGGLWMEFVACQK